MDVDAKTFSPGRSQTDQDTLPCVVESVSQAQKQQSDKLTQYNNVLQRLKVGETVVLILIVILYGSWHDQRRL